MMKWYEAYADYEDAAARLESVAAAAAATLEHPQNATSPPPGGA